MNLNVGKNRLILLAAIGWFHALIHTVACGQMFFDYEDLITHKNYRLSIKRLLTMDPPEADRRDSIGEVLISRIANNRVYIHLSKEMANELSKVVIDYALEFKDYFDQQTFYDVMGVSYGLNGMARNKANY